MTARQIMCVRELIDIVDYILSMGLWDKDCGDWSDLGENRELYDVHTVVNDAHKKMSSAYTHVRTVGLDRLAIELWDDMLDLVSGYLTSIEDIQEGGIE